MKNIFEELGIDSTNVSPQGNFEAASVDPIERENALDVDAAEVEAPYDDIELGPNEEEFSQVDNDSETAKYVYDYVKSLGYAQGDFTSEESLFETLEQLPVQAYMKAVESLPDISRNLTEFVLNKGNDLTVEDLYEYVESMIPSDGIISVDTLDDARQVMFEFYSDSPVFDGESEILEKIKSLELSGKLTEKAREVVSNLNNERLQLKQQKEEQARQDRLQREAASRQLAKDVDAYMSTQGWSIEKQKQVRTMLSEEQAQQYNQHIAKSATALAQLADFYTYFDIKTGQFDFSSYIADQAKVQTQKPNRGKSLPKLNIPKTGAQNQQNTGSDFASVLAHLTS